MTNPTYQNFEIECEAAVLNCRLFLLFAIVTLALGHGLTYAQPPIVDTNWQWQFWDSGTAPSHNWFGQDLQSDSGARPRDWQSGVAPFGFGEAGIKTAVSAGQAGTRRPVVYFRRSFVMSNKPTIDGAMYLRVDDGCVAYLNGREVYRFNVPSGDVTHVSWARQSLGGVKETLYHRVLLSRELFRQGSNTIAVSVHQISPTSDDLYFDLRIERVDALALRDPRLSEAGRGITEAYLTQNLVGFGERIPDGFMDGGPDMTVDEKRYVSSPREVLIADRNVDPTYQSYLVFATSPYVREMPSMERARRLGMFLDGELSPTGGREFGFMSALFLQGGYAGQAVHLGEVKQVGGGGIGRHRAILFKTMADEAGLVASLVRGRYQHVGSSSKVLKPLETQASTETHEPKSRQDIHVWNELTIEGQKYVVDLMRPTMGFEFAQPNDPMLAGYLTMDGQPYYPESSDGFVARSNGTDPMPAAESP